jgi:hypothetical protein
MKFCDKSAFRSNGIALESPVEAKLATASGDIASLAADSGDTNDFFTMEKM